MKKKGILLSLFALILTPSVVLADVAAPLVDDPIITPPVVDSIEQIIYADDNLNVKDNIESSGFMFGNQVDVKGNVDGLAVVAGNTVVTAGEHEYGMYAGNAITINSTITKDLFAAGNSINVSSDAKLGRDAYMMGNSMKINVEVGRNLRAVGQTLDIRGITVNGKVVAEVGELLMDENTKIYGNITYFSDTKVEGLDKATIDGEKIVRNSKDSVTVSFKNEIASLFITVIAGFIVMIALFYFTSKPKNKLDEEPLDAKTIMTRIGIGLVTLIVVPIVSIIALVTGFLTPLALIVIALYLMGLYLASLFSGYIIGNIICKKLIKKDNMYLALIIGILLVKLISIIPIINGYFTILFILYGMGFEYNLIKKEK